MAIKQLFFVVAFKARIFIDCDLKIITFKLYFLRRERSLVKFSVVFVSYVFENTGAFSSRQTAFVFRVIRRVKFWRSSYAIWKLLANNLTI